MLIHADSICNPVPPIWNCPKNNGFGKPASPDEDTSKKNSCDLWMFISPKYGMNHRWPIPTFQPMKLAVVLVKSPFLLFESPKNIPNTSIIDPSLFQGSSIPVPRIFRCAFKCCQPKLRAAVGTARNKQLHLAMLTWKSRNHHYQIGFRVDLALILFSTMLCYFGSYSSIWELLIWDIFRAFVFAHGYRYWYLFGTVLSRVRSADHFESKTGWWCNFTIWKNDGVRQWGWDDIPYMMEKNPNVWNQQSEKISN